MSTISNATLWGRPGRPGWVPARLACGVGLAFAAVSAYWAAGGRWLLDTVGGELADRADSAGAALLLVAWASAAVKIVAAVLPLLAIATWSRPQRQRGIRVLAWVEAVILTTYGLVLTVVGLLVQAGVLDSTGGDQKALAWHAYLWDPWFLVWGVLVTAALVVSRGSAADPGAGPSTGPATGPGTGPATGPATGPESI